MNFFLVSAFGLAGLAAIAVPVILHWLNRKPKYRVEFPALVFLMKSETKARLSGNWRKRIILALRALGIAALALAFCRPYFSSLNDDARECAVLLWDDSFSMRVEPEFSEMKMQFDRALDYCAPRHPMVVGLIRDHGVVWSGAFTGDAGELRAFFQKEAVNRSGSSFARLAADVDRKQNAIYAPIRHVTLFTDRQKLPWEHLRRDPEFRHATSFKLIRPKVQPVSNAYFKPAEFVFEGNSTLLQLTLRNGSTTRIVRGTLAAAGRNEAVTLNPGEERRFSFLLPPSAPLAGCAEFRANDDLDIDNRLFWSCNRAVNTTYGTRDQKEPVNFPALALAQEKPSEFIPEDGAGKLWIEQNPQSLTPDKEQRLRAFLDSGGTLAFAFDGSAQAAAFLNGYQVKTSPARALHKKLRRFAAFNFDHESVARLFAAGGAGAPEVLFFRSFNFEVPPEAAVLARFDDGAPAIAEIPAGGGRIWLFGFHFGRESTNWAGHYTFPTFWRILEERAAGTGNRALQMPLHGAAAVREKAEYDDGAGFRELKAEKLIRFDRPGNYRIDGKLFSVNLPPEESVYEVDTQEHAFRAGSITPDSGAIPADARRELAAGLILLALLCFFGEFMLANRTAL